MSPQASSALPGFELPAAKQYLMRIFKILGPVVGAYLKEMQTLTPRAISVGQSGPTYLEEYFRENKDVKAYFAIKNGMGRNSTSFTLYELFLNLLAPGRKVEYIPRHPNDPRFWFVPDSLEPPGFRVSITDYNRIQHNRKVMDLIIEMRTAFVKCEFENAVDQNRTLKQMTYHDVLRYITHVDAVKWSNMSCDENSMTLQQKIVFKVRTIFGMPRNQILKNPGAHHADPAKQLQRRMWALTMPLFDYLTYLKEHPQIMIQYRMNFNFAGLLEKCEEPTYTFHDFLVDCKFITNVTNHDMSKDEIAAWTIPGGKEGADVDGLIEFFWRQQFQDQEDFVDSNSEYPMKLMIDKISSYNNTDMRTSALTVSNRPNPYIVNLF